MDLCENDIICQCESFKTIKLLNHVIQSFPYENHRKCYKKLTLRSWPVLFTLTYFFLYIHSPLLLENIQNCCNRCFPKQTRPQTTVQ